MAELSRNRSRTIRIIDGRSPEKVPFWLALIRVVLFAAVLFAPGILVESAAMQWAGFVILLVFCFLILSAHDQQLMTIEQARKRLDELEKSDG